MKIIKVLVCVFSLITLNFSSPIIDHNCLKWMQSDGTDCGTFRMSENQIQTLTRQYNYQIQLRDDNDNGVSEICCNDGTGCFTNAKGTPWHCYPFLPNCMDKIKPEFFLYTPEKTIGQTIYYADLNASIQAITLTTTRPFFVIIHGFGGKWRNKQWTLEMKDALIELGNNVLIVKWTRGSKGPDYFKASANTRTVGAAVALVIRTMVEQNKVHLSNTTLAGFSLGAHVAGYVGDGLPGLRRIIGMDPAGPMFACQPTATRLDQTDALFVQVIHTDGDSFFFGGAGTLEQMGDVDFYANGGKIQAGCKRGVQQAVHDILNLNFSSMADDLKCSHDRAHELFTESVKNAANPKNSCNFLSFPCSNSDMWTTGQCFECGYNGCPTFGYSMDIGTIYSGKFYFDTQADNTFSGEYCGSQYMVSLTSDVDAKGNISVKLIGPSGYSNTQAFQTADETLQAGVVQQKVAVTPWTVKYVNQTELLYNRYTSLVHKGGVKQWTLTNSSIADSSGHKVLGQGVFTVQDNVTLSITYK